MQPIKEPWALEIEELFNVLKTTQNGLSDEEVASRMDIYGGNTFHNKEKINPIVLFFEQFLSPMMFLLLSAVVITGFLREWVDMVVIALVILLNVSLGFYYEYNAKNTIESLKTYIKERARVIRNGREEEIDSSLIVPGDVIKLSYGSRIPADARILAPNNFQVDEAILTGESLPVFKRENVLPIGTNIQDQKNIAHAGTFIVEGYAKAVVFATGDNTEIGKIANIVSSTKKSKTPLEKGMEDLSWLVFAVTILLVSFIFFLGVQNGTAILPMLVLSVAVAVGAVPEALPIALTVILAVGTLRTLHKKGIIRKLVAAETLGSTTMIMTDKTGTLTEARMELVGIFDTASILADSFKNEYTEKNISKKHKALLEYALLNVDVSIENPEDEQSKWTFKGRPFEVNIANACRAHDLPIGPILSANSLVMPFNSTTKFSVAENNGIFFALGAPDILLQRSDLSKEEYVKIESWISAISQEGKRIVGLAKLTTKNFKHEDVANIKGFEFLGVLAFYDPIRKEVPEVIKNIENHGIKVVLVTGDLAGTALAVAKSLDWDVKEDQILTGEDIRTQSDEELKKIIPNIKIFARVTPKDKLRIGQLYQSLGEVVAMTGDGVNDTPALKAMDIGISLGSATDVAKSAADLVLLDDNFKTISSAIDEGHRILANIRKTVVYLISNSLDEVFIIGGSLVMGLAFPLNALQIIWVNLFTGSLPALSFAYDENFDKRKYYPKESRTVFTNDIKILTLTIGLLTSLALFLLYYFLTLYISDQAVVRSIFFVCFASYILAITFSYRSLYHSIFSFDVFSNKKLNFSILISLGLLILTMLVPFMREIFNIAPLPIIYIPLILMWLVFNILLVEGLKYTIRIFSNHINTK